jgi:hypothetical protein
VFEEDYTQKWKCAEDGYMTRTPVLALTKDFSLQARGSVQKLVKSVPPVNEGFTVGEVGDLPQSVIHGTNGDSEVLDEKGNQVKPGRNKGKGKQNQSIKPTDDQERGEDDYQECHSEHVGHKVEAEGDGSNPAFETIVSQPQAKGDNSQASLSTPPKGSPYFCSSDSIEGNLSPFNDDDDTSLKPTTTIKAMMHFPLAADCSLPGFMAGVFVK